MGAELGCSAIRLIVRSDRPLSRCERILKKQVGFDVRRSCCRYAPPAVVISQQHSPCRNTLPLKSFSRNKLP
jgi:hypothetical protein